jgi:hypothetical protein
MTNKNDTSSLLFYTVNFTFNTLSALSFPKLRAIRRREEDQKR